MASSSLALARSAHEVAFTSLVAWLRADQPLARAVRTWRVWDGDKGSDVLPASAAQLPWVRLTPEPGPIEPFTFGSLGRSWRVPLVVAIEAAVPGSDVADSMRLWGAIFDCLLAWDHGASGVSDLLPTAAAESVNDSDFTVARGSALLVMFVSVPNP